jgi:hypothetical protein
MPSGVCQADFSVGKDGSRGSLKSISVNEGMRVIH